MIKLPVHYLEFQGEDVGTYAITQGTLTAGNNYTINFTSANLTINKANATVTAESKTKVYGDTDPELTWTATGLKNGDAKNVLTVNISRETGEDVREYTITPTGDAEQGNYNVSYETNTFTITKAQATVTAEPKEKTYGEEDPTFTAKVTGLKNSDTESVITYSLNRNSGDIVGTYTITPSGEAVQGNYDVTYVNGTFTINKKGVTITGLSVDDKIYDGNTNATITGDPVISGKVEGDEVSVSYGSANFDDKNIGTFKTVTFSGFSLSGNDANNYNLTDQPANVEADITVKDVTVSADDITKVYSEADSTLTATVDGLVSDEDAISYTLSRAEGEDVGNYTITPTGEVNQGNYTVTYTTGTFTITSKPLYISSLTVTPEEVSFTGKEEGPTITIKDGDKELILDTDYELSGETTSKEFGTHNFTVTLKGNYIGEFDSSWKLVNDGNEYTVDGNITTGVHLEDGTPKVSADNLKPDLAKKLLSDKETTLYNNGEKVNVYLEVRPLEESEVPSIDKNEAESKTAELKGKVALFLDMSLWKKIGNRSAQQIHDTNGNKIQVIVTVPEELRNTSESVTRTFYIIRVHDGEVSVLASTTENSITFESDQFSTYALSYTDEEIENNDPADDTTDDTDKKEASDIGNATNTSTSTERKSPNTGDDTMSGLWLSMLATSALVFAALARAEKRRRNCQNR